MTATAAHRGTAVLEQGAEKRKEGNTIDEPVGRHNSNYNTANVHLMNQVRHDVPCNTIFVAATKASLPQKMMVKQVKQDVTMAILRYVVCVDNVKYT